MTSTPQMSRRGTPVSSQTQTITSISSSNRPTPQAILRLRGAHDPSQRRIQWAEDVVDNEGLGRKKSKGAFVVQNKLLQLIDVLLVCCIYHRPKGVDESSDESSSSSDSSSDESDFDEARGRRKVPSGDSKGKGNGKGKGRHCDDHDHAHDQDHEHDSKNHGNKDGTGKEKRRPSPNAYERIPKPPKPKANTQPGKSGTS